MRPIKYIVLHCTATSPDASIHSIMNYWRNVLKWKSPGYHYLIDKAGIAHNLQSIEKPSNGVAGYNQWSIHISYVGGINDRGKPFDTRTKAQIATQIDLIKELQQKFPTAELLGHRDFPNVKKACPSFDVKTWAKSEFLI